MTQPQVSRRRFLAGAGALAGAAALGGVAGVSIDRAVVASYNARKSEIPGNESFTDSEPFYGIHQSGIATGLQAHGAFASFNLNEFFDAVAAKRMLRVLTDTAAKLTSGIAPMSDNDPELASGPARLTITIGFGPGFFVRTGTEKMVPSGFVEIPGYSIDSLEPQWSGGDLLVQFGADDPLVLAHASRQISRTIRTFATPKWVQRGFSQARGLGRPAATPRNLMGQVDGTINPRTDEQFDDQVWATTPNWFAGGTMAVVRRIEMELDTWDALDIPAKELSVGRKLSNGAPLTGEFETDLPDLGAVGDNGLNVIPTFAHIRRARTGDDRHKFLRRPFHYDDGTNAKGQNEAGLIFVAYTSDIENRYVPVQNALAQRDLLNKWTTPIGSAVFLIPPGCFEGGYIGQTLFES